MARIVFSMVFTVVFSTPVCAGGSPEDGPYRKGERVEVRGTIRIVGNEPFTRVTVRTTEGVDLFLPEQLRESTFKRQGTEVTVGGIIRIEKIRSADGKYEIIEYHLDGAVLLR